MGLPILLGIIMQEFCYDVECRGCDLPRHPSVDKYLADTEGYKQMVRKAWPEHFLADTNVCKQEEGIIPMRDYDCNTAPKVKVTSANAGAGVYINAPEAVDTAEEQRKYLGRRALDTFASKMDALSVEYKIVFLWRPATVQEAAERLKAGLYTIRDADKKDPVAYPCFGLQDVFSWRGPDDQPDLKGFTEAVKKLNDNFSALMDKLRIVDPKDGLELFEAFKATA